MRWTCVVRTATRFGACGGVGFVVALGCHSPWSLGAALEVGARDSCRGTVHNTPVQRGGISGKWKKFQLVQKLPITHNTTKFVFGFDDPNEEYRVAACTTLEVKLKCRDGGSVTRHYTPVSQSGARGRFELVVKLYPGGMGSTRMFALREGDSVEMRARVLGMQYKPNAWDHLGMIAGGSGVTPMLQLIREALSRPDDTTRLTLLFCSERTCDIILRSELDRLASAHPERFSVVYCLGVPPLGWREEAGQVTPAMVRRTMPAPSKRNLICVCGPPGMMESVAGCSASWGNNCFGGKREGRSIQPAVYPEANNMLEMRSGILYNLGYKNSEVYRF
eukprot:Hpha_TRINITY_DN11167_c0_g1::TRINITY_DN11167_c0_g1_i1::g.28016::m.28016/K00326/E1.6.2.2; cytochrome-b5 reductase